MKQFRRLIIAVAISGLSLGAFAQATQTAPMAAPPPKPSATAIPPSGDSAQADSDYQLAQAKCNALSDTEKATCLSKAKLAYDQQKGQPSSGNTGASGGTSGSSGTGGNTSTGGTK